MRIVAFATLFLLFSKWLTAQTGTISGVVKDSATGVVLESATVSVFAKDSSLVNFQLTDTYGAFQIDKLPLKTDLVLNVTYIGFNAINKKIKIDSAAINTVIGMSPAFHDSTNVVVTAVVPIRMNGDTLEINPAAFKMNPNAVVEDLLLQVPGVTVWADGSITMNGRKIPNVLVDGKPFLGSNDARLATQNLPKDAIDKIQLYQEVDRTLKPEDRRKQDSLLTMNIKLKEDKRMGYFGKAGVGYGTNDRFETDLSLQMYNKKTSFGIGGGYNNINKRINNLQELFQNNTYRNYNPNLRNVGNFNTDGINKYHSIGGVFSHNFIETTNSRQNDRITVNYTKSGNDKYLTNLSLQNRTALDNPQFILANATSNSTTNDHNIGINYIKTNSYSDNFGVNATAEISDNHNHAKTETEIKDSSNQLVSRNNANNISSSQSNKESLSLDYSRYREDNPLKQFSVNVNVNSNNQKSERLEQSRFQSFLDTHQDTSFNRRYNNDNTYFNTSANISYLGFKRLLLGRYSLFGINVTFNQWINYSQSKNDAQVFDYDSVLTKFVTNNRLTNNNRNEKIEYTPSIGFSRSFFKWKDTYHHSFNAEANILEDVKQDNNTSSFSNRNLSRSFAFFRYEGSINYNFNKREQYSYNARGGYRKNYGYANIDQLYAITDEANIYYIRYGNPNLKNQVNHTYYVNGNLNTQNPKAVYAYNAGFNGSFVKTTNPISDSVINDPSGKRYYYYVNADQSQTLNLNYNFNISRKLKKNSIQLQYNGGFNNQSRPGYIDQVFSNTNTTQLNNNINLQLAFRSAVIFDIGKSFSHNSSVQSAAGLRSFKNFSDITKLGLTVNIPKSWRFSTTLDYTKNSTLENPILLWNAFASCRFLKAEQGELRLSAMDILKEFKNISNTADSYGTSTRISNGLQQYFMLTFSYYPRKFGKAANKN
ncbi:MAG TPA: TonB-dependent receptor [Niabella sp.]|nr:TonB-dependent receptor [Niabella sp.]HOZ96164.1 TonB-dependent receptor [Niabella sp.]HQW13529.1 TonB-dependent receptor [Niabella sp.]HQX18923.1 TonB-dependent receptor [Niabella sp.]HQX40428.1 TonB-dependent receptor [Niabella sp.]